MTFMGYEDGSIPARLTIKQATRLLREHSQDWPDVVVAADGGDESARKLDREWRSGPVGGGGQPIRLATLAAFLGY